MSVIINAAKIGKTLNKPKSARPKRKQKNRHKRPKHNPTPPLSNEKTSVWHWILDGVPTTVIFTKESGEVWCNGETLETIDEFAEDDMCGGNVDFCIIAEETLAEHKARITRQVVQGKYHGEMVYILFVDGYMVTEHMGQPPEEAYTNISQSEAMGGAAAMSPPTYDELYGDGATATPTTG